jgi:hypothetical protein
VSSDRRRRTCSRHIDRGYRGSQIGQFLFGKLRARLGVDFIADAAGQHGQRFSPGQRRALAAGELRRLAPHHHQIEFVGGDAEAFGLQDVKLHAERAAVDLRGA